VANQDYGTGQHDDPGIMPDEWTQGGPQESQQDEGMQGSQDEEDQGILIDQDQLGQQDDVSIQDQWQQDDLDAQDQFAQQQSGLAGDDEEEPLLHRQGKAGSLEDNLGGLFGNQE
jgi:hypothetical protein